MTEQAVIPYVRDLQFEYEHLQQVSPGVRRIVARNPSPFTFYGTNTYVIGRGEVAVIDPGPDSAKHIGALTLALEGERVTHILVTHTHQDHSPGAALLKDWQDAPTYGYGPHGQGKLEAGILVEEGGDMDFTPDERLRHGDVLRGPNWTLETVYTPGHTSNHLCYQLREERALFSGDHVMGWSTSVVSPPDGDMTAYLASLRHLLERDDSAYWPAHGPPIHEPKAFTGALIAHRLEREEQIIGCLKDGVCQIAAMVPLMYASVDKRLHPAAAHSTYAALLHLVREGRVGCQGEPGMQSDYFLPGHG